MINYTKGPWYLVSDENGTDYTIISTKNKLKKNSKIDTDHEVLGTSEWCRASINDLRLMAAAPELLEACEFLLDICEYIPNSEDVEKKLLTVIKKAKG